MALSRPRFKNTRPGLPAHPTRSKKPPRRSANRSVPNSACALLGGGAQLLPHLSITPLLSGVPNGWTRKHDFGSNSDHQHIPPPRPCFANFEKSVGVRIHRAVL